MRNKLIFRIIASGLQGPCHRPRVTFDFFGFLGMYVNFQEPEGAKFLTTSDTEFLQILFCFK